MKDPREALLSELMSAYQRGEIDAFDRLYFALEGELRGFFGARCHDHQRVDDLVQETFLQVHRSRRAYLPGLPVRPWLYAIARRVFLMHLRKVHRRESRELTQLADVREPEVAPCANQIAERWRLASALRRLPKDARRAFLLHHWVGMSFREIARRLHINADTAKLRSSRATRRLRILLSEDPGRSHD